VDSFTDLEQCCNGQCHEIINFNPTRHHRMRQTPLAEGHTLPSRMRRASNRASRPRSQCDSQTRQTKSSTSTHWSTLGASTDMNTRKALFATLLLCFGGLALNGQSPQIRVEIKPTKTVVKNHEGFLVSTALRNTGNLEQLVSVWSCSYSTQWLTDNPSVQLTGGGDCFKNGLGIVRIKPGEAYERKVPVSVTLGSRSGQHESVTFRMGFQDENPRTIPKPPRIWSNAVTVNITR